MPFSTLAWSICFVWILFPGPESVLPSGVVTHDTVEVPTRHGSGKHEQFLIFSRDQVSNCSVLRMWKCLKLRMSWFGNIFNSGSHRSGENSDGRGRIPSENLETAFCRQSSSGSSVSRSSWELVNVRTVGLSPLLSCHASLKADFCPYRRGPSGPILRLHRGADPGLSNAETPGGGHFCFEQM